MDRRQRVEKETKKGTKNRAKRARDRYSRHCRVITALQDASGYSDLVESTSRADTNTYFDMAPSGIRPFLSLLANESRHVDKYDVRCEISFNMVLQY